MRFKQLFVWLLVMGAVAFLHFYRLGDIPGLHFDEAWAMNYAWRIAHEPGFWPLTAMSPYTAPWAHYWGALCFSLFGNSLVVFRSSQSALSLSGLAFLGFALPHERRLAFALAVLAIPALAFNHRFAIELNGFHVFAFGLFTAALSRRYFPLAAVAALAGTTAHILFYGFVLALFASALLNGKRLEKNARAWAMVFFAFMAAFFVRVLLEIPEKGKAGALVFSSVAAMALLALKAEDWPLWRKFGWQQLLYLGGSFFLVSAVFFGNGVWSVAITGGQLFRGQLEMQFAFAAAISIFSLRRLPAQERLWVFAAAFLSGLMMLKPAPRYYEITFLLLAASWAGTIHQEWLGRPKLARILLLGYLSSTVLTYSLYFRTAPIENSFQFFVYKDSSRDFLDKQSLVRFLGGSGCALSDIHTDDPRLKESLVALSHGNWPVAPQPCGWNFVSRRAEAAGTGEAFGEFVLRRKQ